jgi:hypothetical protein
MTYEEKDQAITKLADKVDNALLGTELSVCIIALIEVLAAQLMGTAKENGMGREWYDECADGIRDDLIALWDLENAKAETLN